MRLPDWMQSEGGWTIKGYTCVGMVAGMDGMFKMTRDGDSMWIEAWQIIHWMQQGKPVERAKVKE